MNSKQGGWERDMNGLETGHNITRLVILRYHHHRIRYKETQWTKWESSSMICSLFHLGGTSCTTEGKGREDKRTGYLRFVERSSELHILSMSERAMRFRL